MKFTLKCEHYDYDIYTGKKLETEHVIISEFDAVGLDDILEKFEMFLRGNGFGIDGTLDVVKDDYNDYSDHYDVAQEEPDYDHPEANFSWPDREQAYSSLEEDKISMCPVCRIDTNIMKNHTCFDKNCPKESK